MLHWAPSCAATVADTLQRRQVYMVTAPYQAFKEVELRTDRSECIPSLRMHHSGTLVEMLIQMQQKFGSCMSGA